jgi:environmental stress-induced protein Ves
LRCTALEPSDYRRTPWKNGGGVAIDIAGASRRGAAPSEWTATIWRFGRTTIDTAAPFSDLSGFERMQVVVRGRGLVLETPRGEIDVREPFAPVRFGGEPPIVSRLEAGPVDVVNLIGDRSRVRIDLQVLDAGSRLTLTAGTHLFYAAVEACELCCDDSPCALAAGHALQLDCESSVGVLSRLGRTLIGSVSPLQRI